MDSLKVFFVQAVVMGKKHRLEVLAVNHEQVRNIVKGHFNISNDRTGFELNITHSEPPRARILKVED